ncbi:MAG: Fe-Mn family superoxide dismutase [Waterburya sp.]
MIFYYLTYRNKRDEYLEQWWNVVNWDAVNQRLEKALSA